jgi:hypothetical protein
MLRKHWQDAPTNSPLFLTWGTCEYCDTESDQVSHIRGSITPELNNACTGCVDFYRRQAPDELITYVDER